MAEIMIGGIPVSFPFEPYDVQKAYMEKVIECLQNGHNGVLESPTGTGKTLSLLCSSLAWLLVKKAQIQIGIQTLGCSTAGGFVDALDGSLKDAVGRQKKPGDNSNWGVPKIIYASRTHSQLSQAMQELKRTNYRHVKAAVLGSRDQMCIHPEVSRETNNANKIHMCQAKVKTRTCYYYTSVETKKEDPAVKDDSVLDIEDLVKAGRKINACPYYLAKELKQSADIIFMPYNYLLDPKARKANGVDLSNNVIILDEAHNVEHMCEESASLQITSTDIALCIDEITHVMKNVSEENEPGCDFNASENSQPKDFTPEDLCTLKSILLALEKAVDAIDVRPGSDGVTFDGGYIFELLSEAQINENNAQLVLNVAESIVQHLALSSGASPFHRRGTGLQKMADLLNVIFNSGGRFNRKRIVDCYKVHVHIEEKKTKKGDSWTVVKAPLGSKSTERIISYWCFSPGFGMKQLLEQQVRCVILTSGTLAPLNPLISELGIPIHVRLENPHIVKENQIYVKIIGHGPDAQVLNSNYENRNNPKYIASLGRTVLSFSRVVPDGLLIFFPSYPIMAKCQEEWQLNGTWSALNDIKQIYVEPQRKDTFSSTMTEFYGKINDPTSRGACFMAVCRGKVSEGLDFADMNGRAVIVTGLPFPPFKDPRIVLKKKYLEEQKAKNREYLNGDQWYSLEASRAVNQAIGRVIRHKNDYGAILLCDIRFNNPRLKSQLSAWLKNYCTLSSKFGETVGELCRFFKSAEKCLPSPRLKPLLAYEDDHSPILSSNNSLMPRVRSVPKVKQKIITSPAFEEALNQMDFYKNAAPTSSSATAAPRKASELFSALDSTKVEKHVPVVNMNIAVDPCIKRERSDDQSETVKRKKKKYIILPLDFNVNTSATKIAPELTEDFVKYIKSSLSKENYKAFQVAISAYKNDGNYNSLIKILEKIFFPQIDHHYLLRGMERFLKSHHKLEFSTYCKKLT